jgi:hypothetical protein
MTDPRGSHMITSRRSKPFRARCLSGALVFASAMVVSGCGSEGNMSSSSDFQAGAVGEPTQVLFAFYTDADGLNQVARIDPTTLQILETNHIPTTAGGGKQKSYYYEGRYVWTGAGGNVWGMDPETMEPVQGLGGPYIQANRSGEVGLAQVNTVGASSVAGLSVQSVFDSETASLLQRTSWTEEEMAQVDLCTLNHSINSATRIMTMSGDVTAMEHLTAADVLFHNMGYSPVGIEPSPDGKLVMFGVRQGDHILFLDTDPDSPNFGRPARFIHPRFGTVKDANNDVVATFTSAYTAAGGTAPGNHRWNRLGNAVPSETVDGGQTFVEPCDSTMLHNARGVPWSWTPDVDGDTITGMRVDTINTDAPEVYNIALPVVKARNFQAGIETAGPWMASLINRNAGSNEFLFFIEYEGENAEGIYDVTDPEQAYEIQRMYVNLRDVLEDDSITSLVNGNVYQVNVDFTSTGGGPTSVSYRYVALAGDDGSGVSATGSTSAYLQKVSADDPGPIYLLNGLTGRASTSNGTINRRSGSGENTIIFSDEVWLTTTQGPGTLQIVDLRTSPPFRISETVDIPSAFQGYWSPDGSKYFQVVGGNIQVIDRQNRSLSDIISLSGPVSNIALGTYTAPASAPAPGAPGGDGAGGDGGGIAPPPNPCGG